jgi:Rieske Fe-S protein
MKFDKTKQIWYNINTRREPTQNQGGSNMLSISLSIGPCNAQLQTDERLSFDGIETLLNRTVITAMTMFEAHLGAVVKYENYDNDIECDCPEHADETE